VLLDMLHCNQNGFGKPVMSTIPRAATEGKSECAKRVLMRQIQMIHISATCHVTASRCFSLDTINQTAIIEQHVSIRSAQQHMKLPLIFLDFY
jgi:hypothetical protein